MKKKLFKEAGHYLVWCEFKERGCPAKREDYFLTDEDVLGLEIVKKCLSQERKRWVEEIKRTKNHFKGMVGAKKQYHAAEYMKYQILGELNSLEEDEKGKSN